MNIEKLIKELTNDEGLRLKPYKDTFGNSTIGIGRNLDGIGISEDEAKYMLNNDINRVIKELDKSIEWWRQLTEARQHVLCNMAFNLGIVKLLNFKTTLLNMKNANYEAAAAGMRLSIWYKQVGTRAERLAIMMENG